MFQDFKDSMVREFEMTDIGLMSYYLDIKVKQAEEGLFKVHSKEVQYGEVQFG